ncbi:MAG TPA: sulfite exporter TauE/SafE family protein [Clostridiales bacterium]|nr:sulfite exporter TauE/SafE family protein [Clostridiales bacterium]HQP69149.1 sulfite exporter TauE/SafE family protein [Clostridiales bacterium]
MEKNSFWVKYQFTIILLLIMLISTIFVIGSGNTNMEGAPELSVAMIIIMAIVGTVSGLLGGWIGTGGCSVMLPVLHFWLGFSAPIAVGTTLFAVIFTAVSGGYGHFKQKNLDKRVTLWMGGAGIIGVILGSWLFTFLSDQSELLGFIIGLVFLWPSFRMIWEGIKGLKKSVSAKASTQVQDNSIKGHPANLSIFGAIVGTLTGLVGLGGGYALVPGLIYLFGAPVYITMGTSLAVMIPMAAVGGVIKFAQGYVFISAALVLASGTIIGAQIGAATIKKFRPNTLKLIFGIYFLYVAIKYLGNFIGFHVW